MISPKMGNLDELENNNEIKSSAVTPVTFMSNRNKISLS